MLQKTLVCSALALALSTPMQLWAKNDQNNNNNNNDNNNSMTASPTAAHPAGAQANANANANAAKQNQPMLSDSQITARIKALFAKAKFKSSQIAVKTQDQKVSLQGKLNTDMQYEKAISLAESIPGVREVNVDHLKVQKSNAPLSDTYITAKVKGSLIREDLFGKRDVEYWPVSIETKNGIVYLSGQVDNQAQQQNIINIVKAINGVQSVNSSLTVKQ